MLSTCLQHAPTKGVCKPNVSQETIEINVVVIMLRLSPSSFTYAIIQVTSPYFASTSLNCKAMVKVVDGYSVITGAYRQVATRSF